jgi:glycosyltransferase involved in cell wall biosynthesis
MQKNSNVTVFIEIYNEEARIESCLRSFQWAEEIIVFDKNSTDKSREIASKFATAIILVPFCEGSENVVENISRHSSKEWCFFPTASSLMHPDLANEIIKLTSNENFEYDVIGMPYRMYSHGIRSERSPFYSKYKHTLIRRSKLKLSNQLHREISFESIKIYNIKIVSEDIALYHCTHKNTESFWLQTLRYTQYEVRNDDKLTTKRALIDLIKSIINVCIRKRTFMLGMDGIALSVGYIGYFAMRFMFVWDRNRESGDVIYPAIRKKIDDLWENRVRNSDK